jgi:polyferredoxin
VTAIISILELEEGPMIVPSMLPSLIFALVMIAVLAILLHRRSMTRWTSIAMLLVTVLVAGLFLGGVPDPVAQLDLAARSLARGQLPVLPLIGLGLLLATALIAGRAFCGYACPLGAAQELISAPLKKRRGVPRKWADRIRWGFFALFVALAATALYPRFNPLTFFGLQWMLLPTAAFVAIMASSLFVYRPWCNLLCPFGAMASLAARKSVLRLRRTEDCIDCGRCVKACPTREPTAGGTMEGCYYCGRCIEACPQDALRFGRP